VPSTLTVTSNMDSGPGSLRAEIAAAQNNDKIVFASSLNGQTITLTTGVLDLNKNLTIQGPGAGRLTVSGNNEWTAFQVESQTQVTLSGLTIDNSRAAFGGGGILNSGTLTVSNCTIAQNHARYGAGIDNFGTLALSASSLRFNTATDNGGGIYNANGGKLTISQCTLYQNVAELNGGAIYNARGGTATLTNSTLVTNWAFGQPMLGTLAIGGGGLYVDSVSTATLTNCTLANNRAPHGNGGGLLLNLDATATLTNCTLSLNSAVHGGGIWSYVRGILNLTNTIVAGNTAGYGSDIDGAVSTADHNVVGDGSASTGIVNGVNGNIVGVNALLGPLQNNGGPTETMALLAGSPAIGHADATKAPTADERGVKRLDEPGETTDIGAFEL
jgi:hypothetical protein